MVAVQFLGEQLKKSTKQVTTRNPNGRYYHLGVVSKVASQDPIGLGVV